MKFIPKGPINNIPALVQIMAWRRSGDNPLSEPVMVRLLRHICVTRPQWMNQWWLGSVIHICIISAQFVNSKFLFKNFDLKCVLQYESCFISTSYVNYRVVLCIMVVKISFFSYDVHYIYDVFVWNWSNVMDILSALWMPMPWCCSFILCTHAFPVEYGLI